MTNYELAIEEALKKSKEPKKYIEVYRKFDEETKQEIVTYSKEYTRERTIGEQHEIYLEEVKKINKDFFGKSINQFQNKFINKIQQEMAKAYVIGGTSIQ